MARSTVMPPARPTVYRGIRMRSRLEAGYARWLDYWHFDWQYEPCAFAGPDGQYLPDFRLNDVTVSWQREPKDIYVEVKPPGWSSDDPEALPRLMRRMRLILSSEPNAMCMLATQDPNVDASYAQLLVWDEDVRGPWFHGYPWMVGPDQTLGIALRIGPAHGPWQGRWWEAR